MNRLSTRFLIAMLVVITVALFIVPVAQSIAARQSFDKLETDFRTRVMDRTGPPHRRPDYSDTASDNTSDTQNFSPMGPPPNRENPFFREESERLFEFIRDYRQTQRQAIIWGLLGAGLLGVSLALWLSRSIAKPIEAVSKAASSLSEGDLSARVNLEGNYSQEAITLAKDFNRMAESLEHYEGERQAMIADIAHELRTPLATMQFRLDALEDKVVDFNDDEITLLKGQVSLLSRLIDDLRTLSLAEAGKLSFNASPVDLTHLVQRVVRQFQSKAEQAKVRLVVNAGETIKVNGDADRLTQVLNNLLDNALKVTPKDGWIEVNVHQVDNQVTLNIRDSGPGIPEEELSSVFERFVQGKRRDTGDKGSGLGLAIVKSLVTLHGGTVKASNHAEGAQFDVVLPKIVGLNPLG